MYLKEMFLLSYRSLGSTSFQIRKKLQKLFSDKLTSCNLKIVFTSSVRVKSFFTFKDKLPKMLLSGLVYQYKCGGCNATYYGKTKRHFKVRICEHLGISHLTEKKVKIDNNKLTAIQEHLLCCNYSPSFEDFSMLTWESSEFKLKITESLLIARDKPILNKADFSLPLSYFNITSVVIICFVKPYDAHLSHFAYTMIVCTVFTIMLRVSYFIENRM